MSAPLVTLLRSSLRPRMLVFGDVILDRYLWGHVNRISPEAPIPLLRVVRQEDRLGGAGSVAMMLAALDCQPVLAAVIGDDLEAPIIKDLLARHGVETALQVVAGRPTTVKQRFLGLAQTRHAQQMMRVDREDDGPVPPAETEALLQGAIAQLPQCQVAIISDYNKGVCAGEVAPRLIAAAQKCGVAVIADPVPGADYRKYAGCACITPNRLEAGLALGTTIRSTAEGLAAARKLLDFGVQAAIVTLDRDGMAYASRSGAEGLFPVRARQVYDITGAGDMAISVIGFALAGGLDYPHILELANLAGGLEVERLGVAPLSRAELLAELQAGAGPAEDKIVRLPELLERLARRRQAGQRIVMTNGCFDLLHPGHVQSLAEARRLGDCLVVGLNSDVSVRALKGPTRPVVDETGRAQMLAALTAVDYVVLFDDVSVAPLVEQVRPDVLAKAAQYRPEEVVGHAIVTRYGGQVALLGMHGNYSTTALLEKAQSKGGK